MATSLIHTKGMGKKAAGKDPHMNRARQIVMVDVDEVRLDPGNRNRHTPEQVARLAEIIAYQGFRVPVVISARSGLCKAGEGRVLAARKLGIRKIPAIMQEFDSDEQEAAFGVSDNAIALWSELDLAAINDDLSQASPDFNIDLLGIEGFTVDVSERQGSREIKEVEFGKFSHKCPRCGFEFDDKKV